MVVVLANKNKEFGVNPDLASEHEVKWSTDGIVTNDSANGFFKTKVCKNYREDAARFISKKIFVWRIWEKHVSTPV